MGKLIDALRIEFPDIHEVNEEMKTSNSAAVNALWFDLEEAMDQGDEDRATDIFRELATGGDTAEEGPAYEIAMEGWTPED